MKNILILIVYIHAQAYKLDTNRYVEMFRWFHYIRFKRKISVSDKETSAARSGTHEYLYFFFHLYITQCASSNSC